MKLVTIAALPFVVFALVGSHAAASEPQRLANYFVCTLREGKTPADLVAFKSRYEKAVAEAGLEGYELRVQFPMYWGDYEEGVFVWDGSWSDFAAMEKISQWFRQSEWPGKFQEMMTCKDSSLWRVVD